MSVKRSGRRRNLTEGRLCQLRSRSALDGLEADCRGGTEGEELGCDAAIGCEKKIFIHTFNGICIV